MSEPLKVPIDVNGMKQLYVMAKQNGTLDNWAIVALEWMEKADEEILRLQENVKELTVSCETKEGSKQSDN
jgi:hypothetical protein